MGRPPIGKAAMTATERVRRHRAKLETKNETKQSAAIARAMAELVALKRELERGVLTSEVSKLRAENTKLKSDAAKLREKNADLQAQLASMRQAMKRIAKECDQAC